MTLTYKQAISLLLDMDKSLARWKVFDELVTDNVNKDAGINKQSYTRHLILASMGIACKPDKSSIEAGITGLDASKALLVKRKLASIKSLISQAYNKPKTATTASAPIKWKEKALQLEAENGILKNRIAELIGELKKVSARKAGKRSTATA